MPGLIQSIFAQSPFKPLFKHIKKVHECCTKLIPFFEAVFSGSWEEALACQQEIKALEKEADSMKKDIRMRLPTGLFMPFDRSDLLELVTQQDKIANRAKDVAGIVLGRQLSIPADIKEQFMSYITRCLDATKYSTKIIGELDDLLETGFRGKDVDKVQKMVEELAKIESDTDDMQIELRHNLYQRENDMNPIDAIFLYQVLNKIGDLADQAERVGTKLEVMVGRA